MRDNKDVAAPALPLESPSDKDTRRIFESPRLERLGTWSALTLQQSIPIGPGGFGF
jgi:hypothetical protein